MSRVYDKAKYHLEGDYPADLSPRQAFVHGGLYLGWAIERGLLDEEFTAHNAEDVRSFLEGQLSGPQLLERWDGTLVSEMFTTEGNEFTQDYFDFDRGEYLLDYDKTLASRLPSMYHVADTPRNYAKMRRVLDRRFKRWKKARR